MLATCANQHTPTLDRIPTHDKHGCCAIRLGLAPALLRTARGAALGPCPQRAHQLGKPCNGPELPRTELVSQIGRLVGRWAVQGSNL